MIPIPEQPMTTEPPGPSLRLGDYLLTPAEPPGLHDWLIARDEALGRGRGGIEAELAYRWGDETLLVCPEYPLGVTEQGYRQLLADRPELASTCWQRTSRSLGLFVRGRLRSNAGDSMHLDRWHRARRV
jgi:hypothetical protein